DPSDRSLSTAQGCRCTPRPVSAITPDSTVSDVPGLDLDVPVGGMYALSMPRRPRQLALDLRPHGRGGARTGAGRKPNGAKAALPPPRRERFPARCPLHLTWRVLPHVWNLRSRRSFHVIGAAFFAARGMRLCEFSVQ